MNKSDAEAILLAHLEPYRRQSYAELQRLLDDSEMVEITVPDHMQCAMKFFAIYDNKRDGNLRVWGTISWSGWTSLKPLVETFIIAPDGSFVGE